MIKKHESSNCKIKEIDDKSYVFDRLRNKYILLTPEEWVRQNFLEYLIKTKKYSKNLIKLETGLKYNTLQKRSDIIIFDRAAKPFMLIECKAENIKLTQSVIEQASRYNIVFKAKYLCITNGLKTFCFEIDFENNTSKQLLDFPDPE